MTKRKRKNLSYDDAEWMGTEFMTDAEARQVLHVSEDTITVYKANGRLPTAMAPNGKKMLLREGVMQYAGHYMVDSQKPYGKCTECGKPFERTRLTPGKSKDPNNFSYRDGNICPDCRRDQKRGDDVDVRRVTSPYVPHSGGQVEFHQSNARYRLLSCGQRWGKDRCSIMEFIRRFADMLSEDRSPDLVPKVHGFLVAPSFPLARQLWREVKEFFPKEWIDQIYEGDKIIQTKGGGVIELKSADDPDALVAVGLDIVQVTEAARIKNLDEVWSNLRARVNSPGRGPKGRGGLIIANSTPRGKGYWYDLVRTGTKGDDKYDPDFESFRHPTSDNPHYDKEEFEKARRTTPERIFRQEWLAEFIDEADSVFRNVDECATYEGDEEPEDGEVYTIAWDPAQSVDYSAVGVRNSRGETVHITRWTGVTWQGQLERVRDMSRKYNYALVRMDSTGLGKTLPEALDKMGVPVEPVVFSNSVKEDMVNHLAFLMEQKAISYPNHQALKQELKDFKYTISDKGTIRYAAPRGSHDDLVTMMMLAYKDFNLDSLEMTDAYMGVLMGVSQRRSLAH